MKTEQAINLAGNATKLSKIIGVTQGAISQWGDDVPEKRIWQLKILRPMWFKGEKQAATLAKSAQ